MKFIALSLVAVLMVSACGGAPQKREWTLGHDELPRSAYLIAIALLMSGTICGDAKVRACFDMDDAMCVRIVGDAYVRADRYDMKVMSGPEQISWLKQHGGVALEALQRDGHSLTPCRVPGPEIDLKRSIDAQRPKGHNGPPCIRLQGDATPCVERLAPRS
jgi:hypothetical protein